jgi:hypothetical protein
MLIKIVALGSATKQAGNRFPACLISSIDDRA